MAKRAAAPRAPSTRSTKTRKPAAAKSGKPRGKAKTASRTRKQTAHEAWLAGGVRRLGLGLRRGVELADPRKLFTAAGRKSRRKQFHRLGQFCKKELRELAALAARIDRLANQPDERPARGSK